jgi:dihydrofolate reductase
MRRLVYYVATTLDGFIAGPDGGDPTGLPYFPLTEDVIDFIVANYPETIPGPGREAMGIDGPGAHFDTVLEGRRSFELGTKAGIADAYSHLRHLVFSTSLEADPATAVEIVEGDPIERVRELKAEAGLDLWLVGGGTLAHALLPEIDRLILKQNPSVIGEGVPLFNGPFAPHLFTPVATVELPGGVRVVTLDRAGQ